jgi:hypothetical protein
MSKSRVKKRSMVLRYLDDVWNHVTSGVPSSYERMNHTMDRAVRLAVGAFEFEEGDWREIVLGYRSGYWLRTEPMYAAAIINENASAVASIEKYLGRTPLIADGVRLCSYGGDRNVHSAGHRQKERLHVGASFRWKGEYVTVTSMGNDSAIACSYKPRKGKPTDDEFAKWLRHRGLPDVKKVPKRALELLRQMCDEQSHDYSNKVLKRYTITREAIIAERAERKRRQEIWDSLANIRGQDPDGPIKALKKIGVVTGADFDKAPLAKLEKVLAAVQNAK